jgi:hypothetical protein
MKNWLLIVLLFCWSWVINAQAYVIDNNKDLMRIENKNNYSQVYVKLYNGKEILAYKTTPIFRMDYTFDSGQYGDLFTIIWPCKLDCTIMVDRRTGEHAFYDNMLVLNSQKKVGFFYDKKKSLAIIKPFFKPCKKPLTYAIKLDKNSDFGVGSDFQKNGYLKLIYAPPGCQSHITRIIHINYPKLFADCQS